GRGSWSYARAAGTKRRSPRRRSGAATISPSPPRSSTTRRRSSRRCASTSSATRGGSRRRTGRRGSRGASARATTPAACSPRRALRFTLRERVEKLLLLKPFAQLVRAYDGRVPAHFFIAEAPLFGAQVTVDGFVQGGRATIMGVVDSVMYPGTISFERFEYPS